MGRLVLRLLIALAVLGSTLTAAPISSIESAVAAEDTSSPAAIVLRSDDLPPDFVAVDPSAVPSALPDGLARQAVAEFRNESREPATVVRQVVLRFDGRDAAEYLPRFRDVMVRHQGYGLVDEGDETPFSLTRTRGDEHSIVVGRAVGDVMIVTTVTGSEESAGQDLVASLTERAVERAEPEGATFAARADEPDGLSLANAATRQPYFELPRADGTGRWPIPVVDLPRGRAIDVVQPRSTVPNGAPELGEQRPMPIQGPAADPSDPGAYAAHLRPLIDEFWNRVLVQMSLRYDAPGFVLARDGEQVPTGCIDAQGRPSYASQASYCGADAVVYVYEPFLRDDLIAGQEWRDKAFVITTVLAHEWGHHVQRQFGVSDASDTIIGVVPEVWPLVTREQELQADCFAGLFTRYARDRGWLKVGDVGQAQKALERAGDYHFESPGHHGTPEQRQEWFMRGYVHYAMSACEPW